MSPYTKPLPVINEDTRAYWDFCQKHELRMQRCLDCGHIRFPVSYVCPHCHSVKFEWKQLSGRGSIYSFTIYRVAYHPAFKDDIPYVVAIVQLAEGPRMESNIIGCKVEDVVIEMPVEVLFEDITEEISLPKFRPTEAVK
jgi:uncharacterized OB-fold protein